MTGKAETSMATTTLFEDIDILVGNANLGIGSPGPKELEACSEMLLKSATWRMAQPDAVSTFQYGPRSGHVAYRKQLAEFLGERYDDAVNPDDLVVCGGATSGLALLTSYYFSEGNVVFVEDATYFLALTYFKQDCGLEIVCVPTDGNGFIISEFERLVAEHSAKFRKTTPSKPFRALVYAISTYQNPTGRCMPADRCLEVIRVAKANDLLVITDDVYNLLPYSPKLQDGDFSFESTQDPSLRAPPRMYHYDRQANKDSPEHGNVVSVGTFSKILAPGARLGWLEGSKHCLDSLRLSAFIKSGGAVQQLMAGLGEGMLHLGLQQKHLAHCRVKYEERAKAMCRSFKQHLPAEVEWKPPLGGYFMWLKLPENVDGEELRQAAHKEGISLTAGVSFSPEGKFRNYFRVSFTYEEEDVLERAGETIGRLIKSLM